MAGLLPRRTHQRLSCQPAQRLRPGPTKPAWTRTRRNRLDRAHTRAGGLEQTPFPDILGTMRTKVSLLLVCLAALACNKDEGTCICECDNGSKGTRICGSGESCQCAPRDATIAFEAEDADVNQQADVGDTGVRDSGDRRTRPCGANAEPYVREMGTPGCEESTWTCLNNCPGVYSACASVCGDPASSECQSCNYGQYRNCLGDCYVADPNPADCQLCLDSNFVWCANRTACQAAFDDMICCEGACPAVDGPERQECMATCVPLSAAYYECRRGIGIRCSASLTYCFSG